ncbi:hypothetical protein [Fluviicola sp.]|uniref:hypothetical protein n=1 Tax=Fluviicola sp. TaxID=1917219 RepID=UPI00260C3F50|nr:hypothetical protein [Fluviicola sp.]
MKSLFIQTLLVLSPLFVKGQAIPDQLKLDFKQAKAENNYSLYSKAKEQLVQFFQTSTINDEDLQAGYLIAQEFRDVSLFLFIETYDKHHQHSNCTKHNNQ